jgi:uncharacterized membrane protein (Fun14 family)
MAELGLDFFAPLAAQLGFGGVVGFAIGYAVKKILKIIVIFIGIYFISLLYLSHVGFIKINYDRIISAFETFASKLLHGGVTIPSFMTANIPFIGSFIVGFGLGLKVG